VRGAGGGAAGGPALPAWLSIRLSAVRLVIRLLGKLTGMPHRDDPDGVAENAIEEAVQREMTASARATTVRAPAGFFVRT